MKFHINRIILLIILSLLVARNNLFGQIASYYESNKQYVTKSSMLKFTNYTIGQIDQIRVDYENIQILNENKQIGIIRLSDLRNFAEQQNILTIDEAINFMSGIDSVLKLNFNQGCLHTTQYIFYSESKLKFTAKCGGAFWEVFMILDISKPNWKIEFDKDLLISFRELLRFAIETSEHYKSKN